MTIFTRALLAGTLTALAACNSTIITRTDDMNADGRPDLDHRQIGDEDD